MIRLIKLPAAEAHVLSTTSLDKICASLCRELEVCFIYSEATKEESKKEFVNNRSPFMDCICRLVIALKASCTGLHGAHSLDSVLKLINGERGQNSGLKNKFQKAK